MSKTIRVTCCADCPFLVQTMGGFLAALGETGNSDLRGECDYPIGEIHHFPWGAHTPESEKERDRKMNRMRVLDGSVLPPGCPLQAASVTVTLVD